MLAPSVGGRKTTRAYLPPFLLVIGTTAGGLLLGFVLSLLSVALAAFEALRSGIVFAAALVSIGALRWSQMRLWLPQRTCQVAGGRLLVSGKERAALRWGVELGLGLLTFAVTPAFYAFVGIAIATGKPMLVIAACVAYGVIRGATIASMSLVVSQRTARGAGGELPGLGLERLLAAPLVVSVIGAVLIHMP